MGVGTSQTMRVIIRCAGEGSRWSDFLGVPKHLAPLAGEPVLHRTVRLLRELAPAAEVLVVVAAPDPRYELAGTRCVVDEPDPGNGDLDKLASTADRWPSRGRTVILWGDTWWSRPALADVLERRLTDWHAWLRIGPGDVGGELFAFAWPGPARRRVRRALDIALAAHRAGELRSAGHAGLPLRGGWALYRALCGVDWAEGGDHGNSTIVDDWTEDLDIRADWELWCRRHALAPARMRAAMLA